MTEREVAEALVLWSQARNIRRPRRPGETLHLAQDPEADDELLISLHDHGQEVQRFRCQITEVEP